MMGFPAVAEPVQPVLPLPANRSASVDPGTGPAADCGFSSVLYLVGEDTYGGLEDYIREVARSVTSARTRALICFAARPGQRPELADRLLRAGLEVRRIELDSNLLRGAATNLRSLIRLGRWIQERRIDLVHIHLCRFHVYFLGVLLSRLLQVHRVVLHLVGIEPHRQKRERLGDPIVAWMVDRITVISRSLREQVRKVGFRTRRISIIYLGEDLDRFDPEATDGSRVRRELGIPPDTPVVGMVARLHPLKGQETLLRAARRIVAGNPGVRFLLVGTGDAAYGSYLHELARELGVADHFRFLGHRRDIPDVTAALDISVLPSENEAMGHCLLEAMALGKPVVASRVGGIPEVVADGRTGILVPVADPESLATAVSLLLEHPEEGKRLGEAGRRQVRDRFGLKDAVERTLRFYRDLAAGRPRTVYEE